MKNAVLSGKLENLHLLLKVAPSGTENGASTNTFNERPAPVLWTNTIGWSNWTKA
jgi:hypothetical protein